MSRKCLACGSPCDGDACDRACSYALEEHARYARATHACVACDEPCDCDGGRNDYATCATCAACIDRLADAPTPEVGNTEEP